MRDQPRRRRSTPRIFIILLTPAFRFSHTRNAYILRGIGERYGPVLILRIPRERHGRPRSL